jgi:polyvinyl alcohol dehydrogenase (cytochrome)
MHSTQDDKINTLRSKHTKILKNWQTNNVDNLEKQTNKSSNTKTALVLIICIIILAAAFIRLYLQLGSFAQKYANGDNWESFILNYSNSRYQPNTTVNASNIATLKERWRIPTPFSVSSTPLALDGNVYFDDNGGDVYSVNIINGSLNWGVNLGTAISSTPEINNGVVYIASGPNGPAQVFALSQNTGQLIWNTSINTPENAIWGSPTVYNGMLYIGTAGPVFAEGMGSSAQRGQIYSLNATDGKILWNYTAMIGTSGGAAVWSSAVVSPKLNSIYFGTGDAYTNTNDVDHSYSIISLNATSGKENWVYQVYNSVTTGHDYDFGATPNLFSMTLDGATYNAVGEGSKDGNYYIVNAANGGLLEKFSIGTAGSNGGIVGLPGFIYPPYTLGPELFIPAYYDISNSSCCGIVSALIPSTGAMPWSVQTPGNIRGSVSVIPGAVLFGDLTGNMYVVSATNGTELFNMSFPNSSIEAGITVADGYVFVPTAAQHYMQKSILNVSGIYAFSPS